MKCLAIDDEPLALDIISQFCSKIDLIELVACCTNPVEAVKILNRERIDLIFLDIQMPNISGLEFIRSLKNPPLIIFTTAFSSYAIDGFELDALDYLLKPFSFERFFKSVNKAYELVSLRANKTVPVPGMQNSVPVQEIKYLMVKADYTTVKVDLQQILYIEGLKDYVKIYIGKKPLLTKCTMKHIGGKLPPSEFIRVHKSFIIAFSKIDHIENNRIVIGEKWIPVGNQFKEAFYKMLESKKL